MSMYVQIFSITDHAQALHGRYEGPYNGINAELQTSECSKGVLHVSSHSKIQNAIIPKDYFADAKIVLAYRHSDTGVLTGTSENLFCISKLPWEGMPGLAFKSVQKKDVILHLWSQEMKLEPNRIYRIHFGKTIVYLKNFGSVEKIEFTDKILSSGPAILHSEDVDQDLTIAPETGSGIQVKMGQETQN